MYLSRSPTSITSLPNAEASISAPALCVQLFIEPKWHASKYYGKRRTLSKREKKRCIINRIGANVNFPNAYENNKNVLKRERERASTILTLGLQKN